MLLSSDVLAVTTPGLELPGSIPDSESSWGQLRTVVQLEEPDRVSLFIVEVTSSEPEYYLVIYVQSAEWITKGTID